MKKNDVEVRVDNRMTCQQNLKGQSEETWKIPKATQ